MTAIKKFRITKKLTQSSMAALLGFTKSHYVKVELGIRKPGFKFLKALKSKFPEFDVNEIFK